MWLTKNKKNIIIATGLAGLWIGISLLTGTACWFQSAFSLPCPACGSTRSVLELFNGNWHAAFIWHPLMPITIVLLPVIIPAVILFIRRKNKAAINIMLWVTFGVYMGVYVVRMIMYFPHTEPLVPHPDAMWRMLFRYIMDALPLFLSFTKSHI
jgi:hypothetical protein